MNIQKTITIKKASKQTKCRANDQFKQKNTIKTKQKKKKCCTVENNESNEDHEILQTKNKK